jgi:Holliday junction resolvasome RuvABC endonuclease subunit
MILALDLGTSTGWATYDEATDTISSGSWELASAKLLKVANKRCCDPRVTELHSNLVDMRGSITHAYFEDVLFSSSTYQTQLWASLRGVVMLLCMDIPVVAVPVGTLKKFATGNGAATKELMAAALLAKEPHTFRPAPAGSPKWATLSKSHALVTDDEVDARHLLWLARKELKV